ncbi:unnamed protein product [Cochlearia groenlandica]
MDTIVSLLHDEVAQKSQTKKPPNYDFLDCTFLNDIGLLHSLIEPEKRRKKLPIKKQLNDYVKSRRQFYIEAETFLCPFLLEEKHWVGVVVNLSEHKVIVLDCNRDFIDTPIIEALLTPFASALPYVTRQLAMNSEMKHDSLDPFEITIPPLKTKLADPELSGVASMMLLLLHAHNQLDDQAVLSRNVVEEAMQHYGVELFYRITKSL